MSDAVSANSGPEKIAALCERYREELRNFTDSMPGIIAGNEIPTKRADLVKWQGGFKRAAHHLRKAADELGRASCQGRGRGPQTDDPSPNPDKYDDLWVVANKLRNALHLSAMGQNPDTAAIIREADEVLHVR